MRKARSAKLEFRRFHKQNDEGAFNLKLDKSATLDVIAEKMFGPTWYERPKRRHNAIHAVMWRAVRKELDGRVKAGDKIRITSLHPTMSKLGIEVGEEYEVNSLGTLGKCYYIEFQGRNLLIYRDRAVKV